MTCRISSHTVRRPSRSNSAGLDSSLHPIKSRNDNEYQKRPNRELNALNFPLSGFHTRKGRYFLLLHGKARLNEAQVGVQLVVALGKLRTKLFCILEYSLEFASQVGVCPFFGLDNSSHSARQGPPPALPDTDTDKKSKSRLLGAFKSSFFKISQCLSLHTMLNCQYSSSTPSQ